MRATAIPGLGKAIADRKERGTAYFLFEPSQLHPFSVDMAHFRMRNAANSDPLISTPGVSLEELSRRMVNVHGTIISMVDYYMDGAHLDIETPTAVVIYDRIEDHIDAHMRAMNTVIGYDIGGTFEVFEQLGDFASKLYWRVKEYKTGHRELDRNDPFSSMVGARATFMTVRAARSAQIENNQEARAKKKDDQLPPILEKIRRMRTFFESTLRR